jgi:glycosyltransferase involved in cell wall biosynthesis
MISLAITTYNRSGFVIESFIDVLNNDLIDEIVIVDDCSYIGVFNSLKTIVDIIGSPKIKLFRNPSNLGVFANKFHATELSKNDWVISLDSDNVIDNEYVNVLNSFSWEDDVMYCPEILWNVTRDVRQWNYSEFSDIVIDKINAKEYIESINFETHLNTGNNFFNKQRMLDCMQFIDEPIDDICSGDACYRSYLWLVNGGKIKVVRGLSYCHRQHSESWYLNHINEGIAFNFKTYQKIREL